MWTNPDLHLIMDICILFVKRDIFSLDNEKKMVYNLLNS